MTELMKRYEAETGKQSAIVKFMAGGQALEQKSYPKLGPYDYNTEYLAWLEAKAASYDRLMSGGKKTLKEWANFLGLCVSIQQGGVCFCSYSKPMMVHNGWLLAVDKRPILIIPMELIDYSGDWKDSLTLPDGWEEK